jgi:hypothetical protein
MQNKHGAWTIGRSLYLLVTVAVFCISGCLTMGYAPDPQAPSFVEEKNIPLGQALIYFYRPYSFVSSAITPLIMTNQANRLVVALSTGGYFPYFTGPGKIKFWASSDGLTTAQKSPIAIEVIAGETYYVKMPGPLSSANRSLLERVSFESAMPEIKDCKLIQ